MGTDRPAVLGRAPAWVTGGISDADAAFLRALVLRVAPVIVVEIGVAAGTSSAALLAALDALPPELNRWLWSADVRTTCYFDPSHQIGEAVTTIYPEYRSRWIVDGDADARRVRARIPRGLVDLAFVDGDHRHPWPLLDVLHLAPWMQPEAWIALHDIALPRVHAEFQTFGAMWLFEAWPGEKIAGEGAAENIGAVRLPATLEALVPMATELLARRAWEAHPFVSDVDLDLPAAFAPLASTLRRRLNPLK